MPAQPRLHPCLVTLLTTVVLCAACSSTKKAATAPDAPQKTDAMLVSTAAAPVDLSFLLSMSFAEAGSLSPKQLDFPPFIKIAADSIEVFKYTADGKPRKARARGKVFIEMNFKDKEPAKALCQEAFITEDEIILRGKPIIQRGGSMVEGLADTTIFYMFGTSLRVIGVHKVSNQSQIVSTLPGMGSWADGPNPLLPPLTEGDVPVNIRNEMQRAAEAEMLHQQTREIYGPATPAPDSPPAPKPEAKPLKQAKKPSQAIEVRKAVPSKKSFWSRSDRTRA